MTSYGETVWPMEKVQDLESHDLNILILDLVITSFVNFISHLNSLNLVFFICNEGILILALCTSQDCEGQMR